MTITVLVDIFRLELRSLRPDLVLLLALFDCELLIAERFAHWVALGRVPSDGKTVRFLLDDATQFA
jgi:hypothetical protein